MKRTNQILKLLVILLLCIYLFGCAKKEKSEISEEGEEIEEATEEAEDTETEKTKDLAGQATEQAAKTAQSSGYPKCTDSDKGKNYYKKGVAEVISTVSGKQAKKTYSDSCKGAVLTEQYCTGTKLNTASFKCPYQCKDGACINATTPTNKTTTQNKTAAANVTKPSNQTADDQKCTDSDNGQNFFVKGVVDVSYVLDGPKTETLTDECKSNILTEYYCSGTKMKWTTYACQNSCKDGACANATGNQASTVIAANISINQTSAVAAVNTTGTANASNCTDTDGGINTAKSGLVTWVDAKTKITKKISDRCMWELTTTSDKRITEYYCPDGKSVILNCTNSCKNGACINETVTNTTG